MDFEEWTSTSTRVYEPGVLADVCACPHNAAPADSDTALAKFAYN